MVATTRCVTKPPESRITLTALPSRANSACAASRMSLRVAGLVASTRRLVAASSISMSMPTVRAGSSRSTTATVVTSKPSGATSVSACGDGDCPVSILAPRSLSSWNSSERRAARVETQTGGSSADLRHRRLRGDLRLAVDVAIEAFADFAADHAAGQPLRRDHAGAVARLLVVLVVDRLHHRMRDVERRSGPSARTGRA